QYTVWPIATREFMESVPRSVRRTPAPGVLVLAARGALPLREYSPSLHAVHSPSGSTRPRCTRRTPAPGVLVLAARAALPLRGYSPSLHAMRARSGSTPATRCTHCTPVPGVARVLVHSSRISFFDSAGKSGAVSL